MSAPCESSAAFAPCTWYRTVPSGRMATALASPAPGSVVQPAIADSLTHPPGTGVSPPIGGGIALAAAGTASEAIRNITRIDLIDRSSWPRCRGAVPGWYRAGVSPVNVLRAITTCFGGRGHGAREIGAFPDEPPPLAG